MFNSLELRQRNWNRQPRKEETETDNQEKKKLKQTTKKRRNWQLKMDFFPDSTTDVYIMNAPHA